MRNFLCRQLCDHLCEHFFDDFYLHRNNTAALNKQLTALMVYDWRTQRLSVRPQYQYDLQHLLTFARTHMRTRSGKHAVLSIVAQCSMRSSCKRIINVH
jgi:hypothetical protein